MNKKSRTCTAKHAITCPHCHATVGIRPPPRAPQADYWLIAYHKDPRGERSCPSAGIRVQPPVDQQAAP